MSVAPIHVNDANVEWTILEIDFGTSSSTDHHSFERCPMAFALLHDCKLNIWIVDLDHFALTVQHVVSSMLVQTDQSIMFHLSTPGLDKCLRCEIKLP